ncbi:Bug family tripartite tricarboxylate transporter substrate binding protein [Roseovarius sp.]|uniref:Bug family tripartite tricarboxylate transporter substrate binding protein n=1 Tax=Roseovarius sp. TaxID=1486281 RepID=UPI0035663E4B
MFNKFVRSALLASVACVVLPGMAAAEYPEKEVEIVIPYGPGGATDVLFRLISKEAEKHFGEAIVPVNMAGAGATRGSRHVKDAEPDGYTILGSHDTIALSSLAGMVDYSYDAFEPVILLTQTINIVSAGEDPVVSSAAQLAGYIENNPGELAISMIPSSTDHFFWASFFEATGIEMDDIRFIGYPDTGEQVSAVLGGDIDFALFNMPSAGSQFEAGTLTPLAVGAEQRIDALPNTPTLIEEGIELTTATSRGVFVPKDTPQEVIDAIADAYEAALQDEQLVSKIENEFGSIVNIKRGDDYLDFLSKNEATLARAAENMDFSR